MKTMDSKSKPRVLMCAPDYFGIEYEINPWMLSSRHVHRAKAAAQWKALRRVLSEKLGLRVELVAPIEGLPDLVFTANAGLTIDRTFVASGFRHPERQGEEPHWQDWFASQGYDVELLPSGCPFEGEGDALFIGNLLVVGHSFRSTREAVDEVARLHGVDTLVVELADPWFYHLDTCLCPIDENTVLYYPEAFTPEGRAAIEHRFPDAIAVPSEEAKRFACNTVVVGKDLVMSHDCPTTQAELVARGYTVHGVDISEFLKSGGGAKCLVLFLDHNPATSAATADAAA